MITPLPQFDEPEPIKESGSPNKLLSDLRALYPQFLLPVNELIAVRWVRDYKWLGILLLGLFPLAILALAQFQQSFALVCLAVYFSVLWMFFFYQFFSFGEGNWKTALVCFVTTAVIVLVVISLGLEHWRDGFIYSPNVFLEIFGELFTIAIPSYLCRIAVIFFLLRPGATIPSVPAMVYYGLASGLAMGMIEALYWEMGNISSDGTLASFYWTAVLRLTTLSFMQAIWTALATYFFTMARLYPFRRLGLWTAAVCFPLILETVHYSLPPKLYWLDLVVNFFATFMLLTYLFRRAEFESTLQQRS